MSRGLRLGLWLRSLFHDDPRDGLVLMEGTAERDEDEVRLALDRPARDMAAVRASRVPSICLGSSIDSAGQPFAVQVPELELRGGGHLMATGATGSGKSFWALAMLMQLIRRRPHGIVLIDMKGELAKLLREVWLPAQIASLPPNQAAALLARIAVIAPFDQTTALPFQVLTRGRTLPVEVQAHEVASSFGHTIGRDLGILQQTVLKYALSLAIDAGGLSLVDVPRLLQDQAFLRETLRRTTRPEIRAYFAERFARERGASVLSLTSRLDALLMHPSLRRALSTPGMIRFDRLLENAITIVDMSGSPAGMRELSQFFGQIVFQKIVRAIWTRRVGPRTPACTVVCDEFAELVSPELSRDFERVMTLARSQRVFLWTLFQQAAQVEAVSSLLLRILLTNCNYQVCFRASAADARAFADILPATGRVERAREGLPDPRTPPQFLSADEERRALVAQVPSMPDRVFWFWNRRRQYPAVLVKSPRLDERAARRDAGSLPVHVRDLVRRGVIAVPADAVPALAPAPREEPEPETAAVTDNADTATRVESGETPASDDARPRERAREPRRSERWPRVRLG